jgi:ATP-dependent DNA helicase RecG
MYSGGEPKFEEGDIFHITIPLSEVATATVGPASSIPTTEASAGAGVSVGADDESVVIKLEDVRLANLLEFCQVPRTKIEMQECCGIKSDKYFRKNILTPMLQKGLIQRTIPDKPQSPKQKYVAR